MKIIKNDSIDCFVKEISIEMLNSINFNYTLEKFNEQIISKEEESFIISQYRKYGILKDTIKYDKYELLDNPYYKNIRLSDINYNGVRYENKILESRKCLSMSHINLMNNAFAYYDIGYFDDPVNIPILFEGKKLWMSPTIAEQRSMDRYIKKAKGNVLVFGLGIGYYPYMCLLQNNIKSITIVEFNKDIIDLFNRYILPQFDTRGLDIKIIHGDIYDYYNKQFLSQYDYIFVDIWEDNEDGLYHYRKLMQTGIRNDNIGYWIEESILYEIKRLIGIYFKAIVTNTYTETVNNFSGDNLENLKRIHRYFRGIDKVVETEDELKKYINDIDTIRNIIGGKEY